MVWVGAHRPLPLSPRPPLTDGVDDYSCVEAVPLGAAVRERFSLPAVSYVGAHEGCGCGFNSDDYVLGGVETLAEAAPLIDALGREERATFDAEQRSRERLAALISAALVDGDVEVFSCQAGGEAEPAAAMRTVDTAWFVQRLLPLGNGIHYVILGPNRAGAPTRPGSSA